MTLDLFIRRLGYRSRAFAAHRNRFAHRESRQPGCEILTLGPFVRPFNVTPDRNGFLYVVEMDCHRVLRFDADYSFRGWLGMTDEIQGPNRGWHRGKAPGLHGASPGAFARPHAVAIRGDGNLYITELDNRRIQVLSPDGGFVTSIPDSSDPGPAALSGPVTSHFDSLGMMYVADFRGHSIARFGSSGIFAGRLGAVDGRTAQGFSTLGRPCERSSILGGFNGPHAAVPTPDGFLVIADTWNHRLIRVTAEGQDPQWLGLADNGKATGSWSREGTAIPSNAPGGFNAPVHVDIDADGTMHVAEYGNHRIQRFTAQGQFAGWFGGCRDAGGHGWRRAGTPVPGRQPGAFRHPYHLTVHNDTMLMADTENGRVQSIRIKTHP